MTQTNNQSRLATLRGRHRKPDKKAGLASYQNRPMDDGGRWIESPELAGIRFIGFSDGLARIQHSGHFDSEFQESVYRGAVYQLPAKGGRVRLIPAVRHGSESGRRSWSDDSGQEGAAILYLADAQLSDDLGGFDSNPDTMDSVRDMARTADGYAEALAESAREYEEAWQAGSRAAYELESAQAARVEFLKLRRDIKAMSPDSRAAKTPAICAALQTRLASLADDWESGRRAYFEAVDSWSGLGAWRSHLESAFNDGLGS